MQLNCKVIEKVATPPFLQEPPPFQGYPPFLVKFLIPPPPPPRDSIFGRSYPLPPPLIKEVPTMLSVGYSFFSG